MHRRLFITGLATSFLAVTPALAQSGSVIDQVVAQIKAQGYTKITMERTLLGRTRIVAENGTMRREIIVSPATGEILRDYWEIDDDDDDDDERDRRGTRTGDDGDDDDGDDDDGDDDDDDDDD
ncbi:hypothetical protein [Celeribacter sp. SCSIO 80788]|uniref:hypothetical protein n=1 Tax=Celeribacter sp. SCSIO 80788 TaxID=3117013 RepID=UPI003DA2F63A